VTWWHAGIWTTTGTVANCERGTVTRRLRQSPDCSDVRLSDMGCFVRTKSVVCYMCVPGHLRFSHCDSPVVQGQVAPNGCSHLIVLILQLQSRHWQLLPTTVAVILLCRTHFMHECTCTQHARCIADRARTMAQCAVTTRTDQCHTCSLKLSALQAPCACGYTIHYLVVLDITAPLAPGALCSVE
jgi:hypothetical protein